MTRRSLFRKEALAHMQYQHLGTVFLNVPLRYQRVGLYWCVGLFALMCIVANQKYTEKWTLKGFINAEEGVIHSFPSEPGVIEASFVSPGKTVRRGEVLFVMNTSGDQGSASQVAKILDSFQKRLDSMRESLIRKQHFLNRLKPLLAKQYIARDFFDQKREEIVVLSNQIHQLEREKIEFNRAKKAYIKAPITGTISSVMGYVGQRMSTEKPLVSILPEHPTYVAELYVPASRAGLLKVNDELSLHYDAYPYQRFGAAKATVISLSQSILTDKDEDKPIEINQPYYKARARLKTPFVEHAAQAVQQGMTFTAIATGMSRKVWQWLLVPVSMMWRG